MSAVLAYNLLRLLQFTPLRGKNTFYFELTANAPEIQVEVERFGQARLEQSNYPTFIRFFGNRMPRIEALHGLDLGCGYGGKTVEMARNLKLQTIVGIEPFAHMIAKADAYASSVMADNVRFRTCTHTGIPAEDSEFDVILSHDVIEHVEDPRATLAEMYRVMKPGGNACIVFTPYWGALSHHLNYVTRLPGIHWFLKPETLIAAINRLIAAPDGKKYGVSPQPEPKLAFHERFKVLPQLNGVGGAEFLELAKRAGFTVTYERFPTIIGQYLPWLFPLVWLNAGLLALHPLLRDALSFNLTCILNKPAP